MLDRNVDRRGPVGSKRKDAMKARSPAQANGTASVVKFSPRTSNTRPGQQRSADSSPPHEPPANGPLAERSTTETDDFRHRMWANVAALVFTIALTAIGIWLATSIADMRQLQDCALTGRRFCAPIAAPHS
jgi:hypothetical protein